jgi:hypothetical protein
MPGLYLGKPSLSLLRAFTSGYSFRGYELYGNSKNYCYDNSFNEYIENYYNLPKGVKDASTMICENCSSEEEAFYKYFELLEEFENHNKI